MIPRRNHHRRSVPLRLPDRNPKPTIKHNIQKGQVHLYGIKVRYPQHGKNIRQLGVCRRRQNRTEKNQRRMAVLSRSFNLYSDVQRADDIVVILPAEAGEKHFDFEERVKLVNPRITAEGYKIGTRGFTNYILHADDMVKA